MTTSCMRSTLEPEHRLTQESKHYQGALESSVDRKEDEDKEEVLGSENQEDQLKKPRRKDTPILNSPPHIPGARQLMKEKHLIHFEDAEKDVTN